MPRSPIFLVSKGDVEGARKSLQFFRGKNRDVTDELEQIKAEHAESQKIGSVGFFEVDCFKVCKLFEYLSSSPDLEEEGIPEADVHLPGSDGSPTTFRHQLCSFLLAGDF